ncbi:hypothetical protein BpHYR1_038857 [Brachionus plicatilis]|uniref:Uncharacterized protein n=1 Tax=Brachionus plicatilis TaxID=10195 RepID=A0A3M7RQT2_BRAPC|nr:hypothetical protein BpHYR1_038857 [Brachionus plicatilis]
MALIKNLNIVRKILLKIFVQFLKFTISIKPSSILTMKKEIHVKNKFNSPLHSCFNSPRNWQPSIVRAQFQAEWENLIFFLKFNTHGISLNSISFVSFSANWPGPLSIALMVPDVSA